MLSVVDDERSVILTRLSSEIFKKLLKSYSFNSFKYSSTKHLPIMSFSLNFQSTVGLGIPATGTDKFSFSPTLSVKLWIPCTFAVGSA